MCLNFRVLSVIMINEGEIEKLYLLDIESGDDVVMENRGVIRNIVNLG